MIEERAIPRAVTLDGEGPLFKQIERAFTSLIVKGSLKPGDRLPAEEQLSAQFGTSRQTVNKAITELANQGLVTRRRRAGTVVADRSNHTFVLPIVDVADDVAQNGHVYEFKILERRVILNGRGGADWTEQEEGAPLLYLECLHFSDGRPIQFERRFVNLRVAPSIREETFRDLPPGKWLFAHIPWSSVTHRLRAINVTEDLAGKLGISPGAACLSVERRTYHLGEPVTLVQLVHPGDRYDLNGFFTQGTDDAPAPTPTGPNGSRARGKG